MSALSIIILCAASMLLLFGIIRCLTKPYTGVFSFIMEMLWLDFLTDALVWCIQGIIDIFDND